MHKNYPSLTLIMIHNPDKVELDLHSELAGVIHKLRDIASSHSTFNKKVGVPLLLKHET